MIHIFRDASKISTDWLDKAKKLEAALELLPTKLERSKFINKNSKIWGEIKESLLDMSHGKCWYSEAPDAVSDWHVDHFRPKGRALDEDGTVHEGYEWLSFDWKNYRIAGSYPNSPHKDAKSVTRGKWDYFPLGKGSTRASWTNRSIQKETCLILDPANKHDPKLLTFDEKGIPLSADPHNAIATKKVEVTIHLLYLDSPRLVTARKQKWRDTLDWIEGYYDVCPPKYEDCTAQDFARMERHLDKLSAITGAEAAYAATARACLRANDLGFLIKTSEEALIA